MVEISTIKFEKIQKATVNTINIKLILALVRAVLRKRNIPRKRVSSKTIVGIKIEINIIDKGLIYYIKN